MLVYMRQCTGRTLKPEGHSDKDLREDCGVFGISSDGFLIYTTKSRQEWEDRGLEVMARLVEETQAKLFLSWSSQREKGVHLLSVGLLEPSGFVPSHGCVDAFANLKTVLESIKDSNQASHVLFHDEYNPSTSLNDRQ
jgi:hypothetical protein